MTRIGDKTKTLRLNRRSVSGTYLKILLGKEKGKRFDLTTGRITVGRGEECKIVLVSEAVSRLHAHLSYSGKHWIVYDDGSKNGVLVNGERVSERVLKGGDLIQIGDHILRFVDERKHGIERLRPSARSQVFRKNPRSLAASRFFFVGTIAAILSYFLIAKMSAPTSVENNRGLLNLLKTTERDPLKDPSNDSLYREPTEHPTASPPGAPVESLYEEAQTLADQPVVEQRPPPASPKVLTEKQRRSLELYLREAHDYLEEGDLQSAAIAFRFALSMDPHNTDAIKGLGATGQTPLPVIATYDTKSSQPGTQSIEARVLSPDRQISESKKNKETPVTPGMEAGQTAPKQKESPEDRQSLVRTLLQEANSALLTKKFQLAIDTAERARTIEIKGETKYLNEAKQIIDQSHIAQKELFEPFLEQAQSLFDSKAFRTSRDLCLELLRRDESYTPAKQCVERAERELGSLKEDRKDNEF